MVTNTTTRRALIGGSGLAAVVAITPAIAAPSATVASKDTELLRHWEGRQRSYAQIVANGSYYTGELHSPEATRRHDAHEVPIVAATATTARGALAQAWLAWDAQGQIRSEDDRNRYALIHAADFDALADLERRKELDWDDSTMFAVIRSLRTLAGEA